MIFRILTLFLLMAVSGHAAQLTFTNLAQMKLQRTQPTITPTSTNWPVAPNTSISVLGYYEPGDQGGGEFRFNPTMTTTNGLYGVNAMYVQANDGGIFERIYQDPVDARWFGANPKDMVDDIIPLQAAVDFVARTTRDGTNSPGGTVYLGGYGSYRQSDSLILRPRVWLKGDWAVPSYWSIDRPISTFQTNLFVYTAGPSELRLMQNADVPQILVTGDPVLDKMVAVQPDEVQEDGSIMTSYMHGGGISGITLNQDQTMGRYDCHAIMAQGMWNFIVDKVNFQNTHGYMGWIQDCNEFFIQFPFGSGNRGPGGNQGAKGFFMWGTGDSTIQNARFGGQHGPGIWYTGQTAGHGTISGNYIFNAVRDRYRVTSVDQGTGAINITGPHYWETGMPAEWWSWDGAPPGGVQGQRPYWVIKYSDSQIGFATTRSNAFAGNALTFSSDMSGATNWVHSGPAVSAYGSWGATRMSWVGNRFEQNLDGSIHMAAVTHWSISGNTLYDNQFDTILGTASPEPAASVRIRNGTGNHGPISIIGNVMVGNPPNYPNDYGIWVEENYAVSTNRVISVYGNTMRNLGLQNVRVDENNWHMALAHTSVDDNFGGMEIGHENIGYPLTLRGEQRLFRLIRDGHGYYSIYPSGGSLRIEGGTDFHTVAQFSDANTNNLILYMGGLNEASPKTASIYGASSSQGSNNPGGTLIIGPGTGRGTTVSQALRFQKAVAGAGATDPQTREDALLILGNSAIFDANVSIRTNYKFSLDGNVYRTLPGYGLEYDAAGETLRSIVRVNGTNVVLPQLINGPDIGWNLSVGGGSIIPVWNGGSTGGGSVALAMPTDVFNVSGSPGTNLTVTFDNQAANTFFAGPTNSTGAPTFRPISPLDLSMLVGGSNTVIEVSGTNLVINSVAGGGGSATVLTNTMRMYGWALIESDMNANPALSDITVLQIGGHISDVTLTSGDDTSPMVFAVLFDETRSNTNYVISIVPEYDGGAVDVSAVLPTVGVDGFSAISVISNTDVAPGSALYWIRVYEWLNITVNGGGGGVATNAVLQVDGQTLESPWNFVSTNGIAWSTNGTEIIATPFPNTTEGALIGRGQGGGAGPAGEIFGDVSDYIEMSVIGGSLVGNLVTNDIPLLSRTYQVWGGTNEFGGIITPFFAVDDLSVGTANVTNLNVLGTNIFTLLRDQDIASLSAYSATTNFVVDMDSAPLRTITLSDDFNLIHVTNAPAGWREVTITFTASGGNRILSIPSGFKRNPAFSSGTTVVTNGEFGMLSIGTRGSNTDVWVGYSHFLTP